MKLQHPHVGVERLRGPRRAVAQALVLLALSHPPAALPHSLDHLLRMTLEQLLQVEVIPAGGLR